MQVRHGMSEVVLSVGPGHTLRHASKLMADRKVGAAIVMDPDGSGPGIVTERDVLESVAKGQDPDVEAVGEHLTRDLVCAQPTWSLEDGAMAVGRGGFRHLIVVDGSEVAGIVSMRDIVRCWTSDGATSEPARAATGEVFRAAAGGSRRGLRGQAGIEGSGLVIAPGPSRTGRRSGSAQIATRGR